MPKWVANTSCCWASLPSCPKKRMDGSSLEPACAGVAQGDLFEVRRFWEKPSREHAAVLMSLGCLWNSFIMVGRVSAFLKILRIALPELIAAFEERSGAKGGGLTSAK